MDTRDSQSKMVLGGRPRNPDREIKFIQARVFFDEPRIVDGFKAADIKTHFDLINAIKDAEMLKKMRWKAPDTQQDERMTQSEIEEVKLLPSFINWMQNNHGTLPNHPVDICVDKARFLFDTFKNMSPTERQTMYTNGDVKYDPTIAAVSEARNSLTGATSSTSGSTGLTTPANCRSAAAKALFAFEKKIKPNEDSWTKFKSASEWTRWKVKHMGILTVNDMVDITESN